MAKEGLKCKCLRCREVGHQHFENGVTHKPKLFVDEYAASGGEEYFLSFEDAKRDVVYAFCRLRVLSKDKVVKDKIIKGLPSEGISAAALDAMGYPAFIRELHTYGQLINIGKKSKGASQHIGLGKKLIAEAEKICKKNKAYELAVISGVGVREYYKKFGYALENTYMVKNLKR
jgi:elongator complex protein 3